MLKVHSVIKNRNHNVGVAISSSYLFCLIKEATLYLHLLHRSIFFSVRNNFPPSTQKINQLIKKIPFFFFWSKNEQRNSDWVASQAGKIVGRFLLFTVAQSNTTHRVLAIPVEFVRFRM